MPLHHKKNTPMDDFRTLPCESELAYVELAYIKLAYVSVLVWDIMLDGFVWSRSSSSSRKNHVFLELDCIRLEPCC